MIDSFACSYDNFLLWNQVIHFLPVFVIVQSYLIKNNTCFKDIGPCIDLILVLASVLSVSGN